MLIRVKVKAGTRKERVAEIAPGKFEIDVKEKAERNAANERVLALIARAHGISLKHVSIHSGHHRPNKTIRMVK